MKLVIKENHKFISFFSDTIVGFNKYINQIDTVNKKISAVLYCDEKQISCYELLLLNSLLIFLKIFSKIQVQISLIL